MNECPCSRGRKVVARGLCHACWQNHRSRQVAYGKWVPKYVPIGPVLEHMDALKAVGVGSARVAQLAGLPKKTVQSLRRDGRRLCERVTADRVLAVSLPAGSPHAEELAPGAVVPALGTVRRLRALAAAGYPLADLGGRLGMKVQYVSLLQRGGNRFVTARIARDVDALFMELQMLPGSAERTRARAAKKGWAPPLAWDEDTIDDPKARPHTPRGKQLVSRLEEYRELKDLGLPDEQIAERMGVKEKSLQRIRLRAA